MVLSPSYMLSPSYIYCTNNNSRGAWPWVARRPGGSGGPPRGVFVTGVYAPPLRFHIRFKQAKSIHTVQAPTAQSLTCLDPATLPCRGNHQTSMPHGHGELPKHVDRSHKAGARPLPARQVRRQPSASPEPVACEPALATSFVQSDHPHGPTSTSFEEVDNTSRTRVLHTRCWPYSVGRFTKATTCMQRPAPCE